MNIMKLAAEAIRDNIIPDVPEIYKEELSKKIEEIKLSTE